MTDEEELSLEVQKIIDRHRFTAEVSPSWVATAVMQAIKFPRDLHRLGYVGCHLELRQIARGKLRRQFDPATAAEEYARGQSELFPDTLQDRYPRKPKAGEEPMYVFREVLSDEDCEYNLARMEKAGHALLKHADAFRAWWIARRRSA